MAPNLGVVRGSEIELAHFESCLINRLSQVRVLTHCIREDLDHRLSKLFQTPSPFVS